MVDACCIHVALVEACVRLLALPCLEPGDSQLALEHSLVDIAWLCTEALVELGRVGAAGTGAAGRPLAGRPCRGAEDDQTQRSRRAGT